MSSVARRVPAPPPGPALGGRCAIVLAEGDAAKAHLLSGSASELLARWDGLRPGLSGGGQQTGAALVIRARDLLTDAGVLAQRLSADPGGADGARLASEALHAEAQALLDDSGTRGAIPRLLARLRALESELAQALGEEESLAARIDALHGGLAAAFELERERAGCAAAFDRWSALLHLVGDSRELLAARRAVEPFAGFATLPPDTPRRMLALAERRATVDGSLRALEHRAGELLRERDAVTVEPATDPIAADALRLGGELASYRSRLLELAALRARLAELEQGAGAAVRRLGADWDEARVAATAVTDERAGEIARWQQRFRDTRGARDLADGTLAAARTLLDRAATAVRTDLAAETPPAAADDDGAWRAVWQLRAALDEIWQVQSRAEGRARAVRDREAELVGAEAQRRWRPSQLTERRLGWLTVLAALGAVWGHVSASPHWQFAALAAVAFGVSGVGATLRRRWAAGHDERLVASCDRLRRDIIEQRRGRDADWSRAARLSAVIDTASGRLGLAAPVTLEAVEAREQELSARLRADGPRTELTRHLVELLDAQDEEHTATQAAADARDTFQRLEQEWAAWRGTTDLPADLDGEQSGDWLARLREAATTLAARDSARARLRDSEPAIAAWEGEARALLVRARLTPADDLCGSELTIALAGVRDRVERVEAARERRERLTAELAEVDRLRLEHQQERDRLSAEWAQLLSAASAVDEAALRAKVEGFERWATLRAAADALESALDESLAKHGPLAALRSELERDDEARWTVERATAAERIATIDRELAAVAARRAALDGALESSRGSAGVTALRDEQERLLGEIGAAARRWQTTTLAAALLDDACREQLDVRRQDLMRGASTVLKTLTEGAYALASTPDGLFLHHPDARRTPVAGAPSDAVSRKVALSLLLAHAAQRGGNGRHTPIVLDDILSALPADEVAAAAAQIAELARLQPTLYLTTPERHAAVTAALSGALATG